MIALNRLHDWYNLVVYDALGLEKEQEKYVKPVGIGLLVLFLAVGGWYVYRTHAYTKDQEAFKVFNECLAESEKAVEGRASWQEVDAMCQKGYERYKSTGIAPYIVAIRIEALLAQQNYDAALEQSSILISQLSSSSPLYNLYKTKHALLQMDSAQENVRAEGVQTLQSLAEDVKNNYNDVALYYLGLHHMMNNEIEKAKEVWTRLVTLGSSKDRQSQSPWASRAQEKLQYL